MKILIFGKGFVGSRMADAWPDAAISTARIDDKEAVIKDINEFHPDVVVNAAGKTGTPNVDWCETHQTETTRSNVIGPLVLAEACAERGIYLLHLASGCIFYGPSPDPAGWREDDFANPSAFYSRTKYATDLLLSRMPNIGIARLRMPIDHIPSSRNLIDKLAGYSKVIDVANSVTVVEDLLSACRQLLEKRAAGIFHVVNPGVMRHRDLLALYREYVDPNHSCEWIMDQELVTSGLAKKQRSNCILQSPRLETLGIRLRPIEEALRDTMQKYAAHTSRKTATSIGTPFMTPGSPGPKEQPQPFHFLKQKPHEMRGVILAGGKGTRLAPLTHSTNKHLLPVFNKQMILYPLQTLLDAGIRQIMLVTGPDFAGQFMNLLGSGANLGCRLTYRIQDEAGGIAHALAMAENFVDGNPCTVILGDNIFDENLLPHISSFQNGAMAFYKLVDDPQRFGVMEIDNWGNVLSIEEKPKQPKSNFAQVGLYVYEPSVFEIIKTIKPSGRGELEITDVNNAFLTQHKLIAKPIRGFWSDAGTFPSLKRASEYFATKQQR
ncbi:NAD-dependent epimerase/dehydratase family protein [Candidatus Uhrbacteria bacterium]|nr:NAD-dependent epimerase/dehydratase family protein [Candidatus Uhrbacteria bacterium]